MDQRGSLRWLERGLCFAGLLLVGLWVGNETQARAFQAVESRKLDAARSDEQVMGAAGGQPSQEGWCPATLESGVFGRIEIPRLAISALIAEGTQPAQLDRAVGHVATTAFPGQPGNCGLAGHRDTFLRGLGEVREGDVIRIDTLQDSYSYEVEWGTVVEPNRVDVLAETASPSLTLVTCYPFLAVGPSSARFVVRARLVGPNEWNAQ